MYNKKTLPGKIKIEIKFCKGRANFLSGVV